jgi:hypothetical protein
MGRPAATAVEHSSQLTVALSTPMQEELDYSLCDLKSAPLPNFLPSNKRAAAEDDEPSSKRPRPEQSEIRKPLAYGEPPVWADKRQALCEATPYFKSYQGGMYTNDCVMLGCLIDGFPGPRDLVDSDIVIVTL